MTVRTSCEISCKNTSYSPGTGSCCSHRVRWKTRRKESGSELGGKPRWEGEAVGDVGEVACRCSPEISSSPAIFTIKS